MARNRANAFGIQVGCCAVLSTFSAQLSGAQQPRVYDSAGIVIVSNPSISGSNITLHPADRPSLDLGGLHETNIGAEFSRVALLDIMRLPNGLLVVPDGYQVKLFDSSGHLRTVLGRSGEGPGEFKSNIIGLCMLGADSFVALESSAPRISVYTISGRFVRTVSYPSSAGHASYRACVVNGGTLTQSEVREGGSVRARYSIVTPSTLPSVRFVGVFPSDEYAGWFSRDALLAAHENTIYSGDGLTFEFRMYDLRGRLLRIVRTADALDRFAKQDVEKKIERRLAVVHSAKDSAELRAAHERAPQPAYWPAYERLFVDDGGRTWLADQAQDGNISNKWTLFDVSGRLVGRADLNASAFVRAHPNIRVVRWNRTEVVMKYSDDAGAYHVCIIPLLSVR